MYETWRLKCANAQNSGAAYRTDPQSAVAMQCCDFVWEGGSSVLDEEERIYRELQATCLGMGKGWESY